MPLHRAFFSSAGEARDAASKAIDTLRSKWMAATSGAGATVASVSPTVAVLIDSVVDVPATAISSPTYSDARVRITGPDGRSELAQVVMPKTQADALISAAGGTAYISSTKKSQAKVKARIAKSVQVIATTAASTVLTGLVLEDRNTGKQYTCGTHTSSAAGAQTVDVVEADSGDLNDVTHGTVLEFVAPPTNIVADARVIKMLGFTVTPTTAMKDAAGRAYITNGTLIVADSGLRLSGDHTGIADVVRDPTDLLEYATSLVVGDAITFDSAPAGAASSAIVTRTGGATVPKGTVLEYVAGATKFSYEVTAETKISDALFAYVPFKASILGPTANRAVGNVLTLPSPPTDVDPSAPVHTAVAAAAFPEAYASQVIGGEVEWSSRVYPARDGRWIAEVFTVPFGS